MQKIIALLLLLVGTAFCSDEPSSGVDKALAIDLNTPCTIAGLNVTFDYLLTLSSTHNIDAPAILTTLQPIVGPENTITGLGILEEEFTDPTDPSRLETGESYYCLKIDDQLYLYTKNTPYSQITPIADPAGAGAGAGADAGGDSRQRNIVIRKWWSTVPKNRFDPDNKLDASVAYHLKGINRSTYQANEHIPDIRPNNPSLPSLYKALLTFVPQASIQGCGRIQNERLEGYFALINENIYLFKKGETELEQIPAVSTMIDAGRSTQINLIFWKNFTNPADADDAEERIAEPTLLPVAISTVVENEYFKPDFCFPTTWECNILKEKPLPQFGLLPSESQKITHPELCNLTRSINCDTHSWLHRARDMLTKKINSAELTITGIGELFAGMYQYLCVCINHTHVCLYNPIDYTPINYRGLNHSLTYYGLYDRKPEIMINNWLATPLQKTAPPDEISLNPDFKVTTYLKTMTGETLTPDPSRNIPDISTNPERVKKIKQFGTSLRQRLSSDHTIDGIGQAASGGKGGFLVLLNKNSDDGGFYLFLTNEDFKKIDLADARTDVNQVNCLHLITWLNNPTSSPDPDDGGVEESKGDDE